MRRLSALLSFCLAGAVCFAGATLYVDDDAPNDPGPGDPLVSDPAEDGSQAHPFDAIQQAIDAAANGDEVIILPGTYTGEGNRDIDFKGKAITVRGANPDDPNTVAATIIDCQGTQAEPHRGFYFHIGETESSVLMGLTITRGYAQTGGGILCDHSSPVISDCVFTNNCAMDTNMISGCGGAIACKGSDSNIRNCTFSGNVLGGFACFGGNPSLAYCRFFKNTSDYPGGAVIAWESSLDINACTIVDNRASLGGGIVIAKGTMAMSKSVVSANHAALRGGGILVTGSTVTITSSLLTKNAASRAGGALTCIDGMTEIHGCTVASNRAGTDGGGIYAAASGQFGSSVVLRDSILWGNRAARGNQVACETDYDEYFTSGYAELWYSVIEDGMDGTFFDATFGPRVRLMDGTIDADPLFADPGRWDDDGTPDDESDDKWINGDYHLKSYAGRWDPASEQWVMDNAQSPCIDAGSPASDYSNEPAYNGGRVNMGAYGNTPFASKTPNCPARPVGDLDDDCKVTFADLALFAAHWLDCNLEPSIACE